MGFNLCYDMLDKSSVFHSLHCCSVCNLQLFFMAGTRWSTLWNSMLCLRKIAAILFFPPFLYLCVLYFCQQPWKLLGWAHTEVVSSFSYTVLLHFLKELRITLRALQLVRVLKNNTWIGDRLDSSALQIFACVQGFCPSDNCSLCVWS